MKRSDFSLLLMIVLVVIESVTFMFTTWVSMDTYFLALIITFGGGLTLTLVFLLIEAIYPGKHFKKIMECHAFWLKYPRNVKGKRRANFTGRDFSGKTFNGYDFTKVIFKRADLSNAIFKNCILDRANLVSAKLRNARFINCQVTNANLTHAVGPVTFEESTIEGSNLDFSMLFEMSCRALSFEIDTRQAQQMMYHVIDLCQNSGIDLNPILKKGAYKWVSESHLVSHHDLVPLKPNSGVGTV